MGEPCAVASRIKHTLVLEGAANPTELSVGERIIGNHVLIIHAQIVGLL
jgi:hypothetical protein